MDGIARWFKSLAPRGAMTVGAVATIIAALAVWLVVALAR